MPHKQQKPDTLIDRALSALFFCVPVTVTVALIPLALSLKANGKLIVLYAYYTSGGFAVIAVGAFVIGFMVGSDTTFRLLGYMWGTERPANPQKSLLLWLVIIGAGVLSYRLAV